MMGEKLPRFEPMGILSFLAGRKNRPRPTGSGEFIDNIRWWFWDDKQTPGMLTRNGFDETMQQALSEDEHSWMLREVLISIRREKPASRENIAEAKRLFGKIGAHLAKKRENEKEKFKQIVIDKWTHANTEGAMLDVLRAHINVLESWGYPYKWCIIKDARDWEDVVLLLIDGKPSHFFREEDIREINGRPYVFSIWVNGVGYGEERIGGGNWHFHYEDGGFDTRSIQHGDQKLDMKGA
jgi:hypothetical protein